MSTLSSVRQLLERFLFHFDLSIVEYGPAGHVVRARVHVPWTRRNAKVLAPGGCSAPSSLSLSPLQPARRSQRVRTRVYWIVLRKASTVPAARGQCSSSLGRKDAAGTACRALPWVRPVRPREHGVMLRAARRMFSTVTTLSLAGRALAAPLEPVGVNRVKLLAVRLEPPEVRLLAPVVHTTPYLCPHDSIPSATGV